MKLVKKPVSKLPFFKRGDSNVIEIKPITFGDFNKLPYAKKEGDFTAHEIFQQHKSVIFKCTDLTEQEFEELKAPDFNQLAHDITDFIGAPSDELKGEPLDGETFAFDLLFPFENEVGEQIHHIKFRVPTVAHSEALADITESEEREAFMFRCVCDLTEWDMNKMAMNDYLAIKPQVGAFFTLSADYFRPTTFKA